MAFGARNYTLDQVLAAINLLEPGFGQDTTHADDLERAPGAVVRAVQFLDGIWDARIALKLPNHLVPDYGSPGRDWMKRAAEMEDQHESVSAGVPASPPVPHSTAIDEREFIRQAVAVFEMLELRKFDDGDGWNLTVKHGSISASYSATCRKVGIDRPPAQIVDGDALLEAFLGLVAGCVRDGRRILAAYDAQRGTP